MTIRMNFILIGFLVQIIIINSLISLKFGINLRNKISFPMSSTEAVVHQVFIGNLPQTVNEDILKSIITEKTGPTFKSVRIQIDKQTGLSRGFGYVHFDEKEQAESAILALAGIQIEGNNLKIDLSQPRVSSPRQSQAPSENSVFIGNLDFRSTEEQILEMCNDLVGKGSAIRVRLATDRETGGFRRLLSIFLFLFQFDLI
jgi:nucleolin